MHAYANYNKPLGIDFQLQLFHLCIGGGDSLPIKLMIVSSSSILVAL